MTPANETCIAWVSPQRLSGRWLPEMFRAEYLEFDGLVAASDEYAVLSDFVHIVSTPADATGNTRWRADTLGIKRTPGVARDQPGSPVSDFALPPEALLVTRRWTSGPNIFYWNDSLYAGGGAASTNLWVLVSNDGESIAWIERELASEIGLLQLQRAGIGSVINVLTSDLLLNIQIRRRSVAERRSLNETILRNLRSDMYSASYRALKRPIILTGVTFEDRLREFERFLAEDTLFNSADAFFVESATRNESSDLFVIRAIGQHEPRPDSSVFFVDNDTSEVDASWREWYWSGPEAHPYRIFNSVVAAHHRLPNHLLTRTTAGRLPFLTENATVRFVVPGLAEFASAFEHSATGLDEFSESTFASNWLEANERLGLSAEIAVLCDQFQVPRENSGQLVETVPFISQLADWASATYRPAVAVRVIRDRQTAGVYLLFGNPQNSAPSEAYSWLDDMGMAFQEILSPPPQIVEEASRRESLRRLSWMMHQINGPIGRARQALEDIHSFLSTQPELAQHLVPDEETVRKRLRTRETGDPTRFTLSSRLSHAMKQIEDIRRVAYQIKRLKRVQGELVMREFDLIPLLRERAQACVDDSHTFDLELNLPHSLCLNGNAESIRDALDEVLNNACREMAEHHSRPATLTVRAWTDTSRVYLSITDTGLPVATKLIPDPFEEDASTYAKKGRGSGLGLAIVRETFAAHGGECQLTENHNNEGERVSGVTFTASMSLAVRRGK